MERIFKQDYETLKYYAINTRAKLQVYKQQNDYEVKKEQEDRMIQLGYIDWNEKSNNLYHPEHILTIDGIKKYSELRETWRKDTTILLLILSFVISFIALYFSLFRH